MFIFPLDHVKNVPSVGDSSSFCALIVFYMDFAWGGCLDMQDILDPKKR